MGLWVYCAYPGVGQDSYILSHGNYKMNLISANKEIALDCSGKMKKKTSLSSSYYI